MVEDGGVEDLYRSGRRRLAEFTWFKTTLVIFLHIQKDIAEVILRDRCLTVLSALTLFPYFVFPLLAQLDEIHLN